MRIPYVYDAGVLLAIDNTTGAIIFASDPRDIARLGAAAEAKPGLVVRGV